MELPSFLNHGAILPTGMHMEEAGVQNPILLTQSLLVDQLLSRAWRLQGENADSMGLRVREPSSPLAPITQTNQRANKRVHFTPEKVTSSSTEKMRGTKTNIQDHQP